MKAVPYILLGIALTCVPGKRKQAIITVVTDLLNGGLF
jgi:hypothetical protein